MTPKEERAVVSRINPEFTVHMKKQVVLDYPRFRDSESYDETTIRTELARLKEAIADAIHTGEHTEDLLVRREVLYLLAEDKGLM